jgi:phenylalanyl-tRNA synthetase beta chain
MNIRPTPEDPFIEFQEDARVALASAGFRETITFPFVSGDEYQALGLGGTHPLAPSLSLKNPLADNVRHLRTTLVPGLLRAAAANRRKGELGVRLFECGRGYFRAGTAPSTPLWRPLGRTSRHIALKARDDKERPIERHWIAALIDQPLYEKSWDVPETAAGFHAGKGAVLALTRAMGLPEPEFRKVEAADLPFLHPGAAATVFAGGKLLGYVGELHPKAAMAMDLPADKPPIVLELDLETVFGLKGSGLKLKGDLQRFPPVTRDVALLVDAAKTHGDFEAAVRGFKKKQHLARYRLFDVYQGDKLPAGKKSVAYTLYFQSAERTLADQDVEPEMQALVAWLGEQLGAVQR